MARDQKINRDALDRTARMEVRGRTYTFRVRDIFTSEWGAAVAVNAGVHAGPGRVSERFGAGLREFFAAHPEVDPAAWAVEPNRRSRRA